MHGWKHQKAHHECWVDATRANPRKVLAEVRAMERSNVLNIDPLEDGAQRMVMP